MTLDQIGEILVEVRADVKNLRHDLDADYKAIHGNGHPGLIDNVNRLREDQKVLQSKFDSQCSLYDGELREMKDDKKNTASIISNVIAHIIAIGTAALAYFS